MTEAEWRDDEISLFAVGNTLLRNRWRLLRWTIAGGALAALSVFSRKPIYRATASFIPQGTDAGRSGLASIAGQFGVTLATGSPSQSPDFYAQLLKSPALLLTITRDTFVVQEMGGRRLPFLDLFEIRGGSLKAREERGVRTLAGLIKPSVSKNTGIVDVSAETLWPSVSVAIVSALVNGVDEFNQRARQSQAAAERKFVEGRLSIASADLRAAEDRLQAFLQANLQLGGSQGLAFQRERLQREVMLRQQVFTSLTESYEEVRIREVRDTPVITIFEPPSVPTQPEPRGRLKVGLIGLAAGALIGIVLAFASGMMARSRGTGNPEADEFIGTLGEVKGEVFGPFRWITGFVRR